MEEIINQCRTGVCSLLVNKLIEKYNANEGEAGHLLSVEISCVLKDVKCSIATSSFFECILAKLAEVLHSKAASKVMPSALRCHAEFTIRSLLQLSLSRRNKDRIYEDYSCIASIPGILFILSQKKVLTMPLLTNAKNYEAQPLSLRRYSLRMTYL